MRGTRLGRLRTAHLTRWGMAAVAAAMVAASAGGGALASGSGEDPGFHASGPVRLDTSVNTFGGWNVGALPDWLIAEPSEPVVPVAEPQIVPASDSPAPTSTSPVITALSASGIPEVALRAYVRAQDTMAVNDPGCGIRWSLLAGIGRVEANHGRFGGAQLREDGYGTRPIRGIALDGRPGVARILDTDGGAFDGDAVYDRAVGPMQFIPTSWQAVAADGNGDGRRDPNNIYDAALGAAVYLCAGDANLRDRAQMANAVFRYNHSQDYVALVLALAAAYEAGLPAPLPQPGPAPVAPPKVPTPVLPPVHPGPPLGVPDPTDPTAPGPATPPADATPPSGDAPPGQTTRPTTPPTTPTDPPTTPTDPTTPPDGEPTDPADTTTPPDGEPTDPAGTTAPPDGEPTDPDTSPSPPDGGGSDGSATPSETSTGTATSTGTSTGTATPTGGNGTTTATASPT